MRPVFALAIAAAFIGGCRNSDRRINLPEGEVRTGPTLQVQPVGSMPMAISANGSRIAVAIQKEGSRQYTVEVRDLADMKVRRSWEFDSQDAFPILLTQDGSGLIVAESERGKETTQRFWRYDVASGNRTLLSSGANGNITMGRNHSHTILGERNSLIVTVTGKTHMPTRNANVLFDAQGNAWYGSGSRWTRVTPAGKVERLPKPKYLVKDPTTRKSHWTLVAKESTLKYKESEADITTIWLESSRAVPYARPKGENINYREDNAYRAGLVWSGPDVYTFGFVPNRDLVYVVTADGSYLVPFGLDK